MPSVRTRAASNSNAAADTTGTAFGPYTVYEELGSGGMAAVHRAVRRCEDGTTRVVALKRMWPRAARSAELVAGFLREAEVAGRLCHRNIARALAHGTIDGTHYIEMELVAGATLKQILVQSQTAAGPIPVPVVIEIVIQLCDALAYAHGRGVIHRDVSPANVVVSSTGAVKLIDFGIAKAVYERATTAQGIIKGKYAYLAPEYTHGHLDHRVDLFGAGVILHELLCGRGLFDADTDLATVANVRNMPVPLPSTRNPEVNDDLDHVVMMALERDPARRWQTAGAMAFALRTIARELGGPLEDDEVRAWAEWAFTRTPRRATVVERMIHDPEPSLP